MAQLVHKLSFAQATPTQRGVALGLLAASIGAVQTVSGGYAVAQGLSGLDLAALRYAVAGAVLAPLFWRFGGFASAGGIGWQRMLILLIVGGPAFTILLFSGFAFAPYAHGAVLPAGAMAMGGILFASLLAGEALSRRKFAGLGLLGLGLALLGGASLLGTGDGRALIGDALFISAGLLWALYVVLLRRWQVDALKATAALSVLVGLVYLPIYAWQHGFDAWAHVPLSLTLEIALVQGVLVGVVVTIAFAKAVALLGAARAAVFPALVPGLATLLGIPMLGEWPAWSALLGLVVVGLGQIIILQTARTPMQPSAPTPMPRPCTA
jgi:drug/metabolite transporter (DMT)-like permease